MNMRGNTFTGDMDAFTAEDLDGFRVTEDWMDIIRADVARLHGTAPWLVNLDSTYREGNSLMGSFTVREPQGLTGDIAFDEVAVKQADGSLRFETL